MTRQRRPAIASDADRIAAAVLAGERLRELIVCRGAAGNHYVLSCGAVLSYLPTNAERIAEAIAPAIGSAASRVEERVTAAGPSFAELDRLSPVRWRPTKK